VFKSLKLDIVHTGGVIARQLIEVSLKQREKQEFPKDVTEEGIIIDDSCSQL
jgi:hypothetical protein